MVNILKAVIKEENKMSRDIIKTLNDRMNKLIKMVNRLPEGEQEFLEYISKFKAADGYYQLGSDRELCGGGSDSYYDFVVYPTYEVAIGFVKLGLKDNMRDTLMLALERGFEGHGYDCESVQMKYLEKLYEAGIGNCDNEILAMVNSILSKYRQDLDTESFPGFWDRDEYREAIRKLLSLYESN